MVSLTAYVRKKLGFNPWGWERARKAMDSRVAEFLPSIGEPGDGPSAWVVIAPWGGTSIPWFTLALALMMAKQGARIRFIVDDVRYGGNPLRHRVILRAIKHVMRRVAKRLDVSTLSDFGPQPLGAEDRVVIARLAELNATWALRGEMPQRGRQSLVNRSIVETSVAQGHIAALFGGAERPDLLFVPGGIFGDSGLWFREARKRGIRVASFDTGGYQTMMLATDGMACQLQDVPRAFRILGDEWAQCPSDRAEALARADKEIAQRRQGTDTFESQLAGAGAGSGEFEGGILIALNSSWDAAALGPHRVFPSNTDWILGTVRYLLENTDRPVIVRQHPAERLPIAATSEDYALMLRRAFGTPDRLFFIAAADPINSYALLDQVAAVVVHTSTIGMEAVAFGRPVVTGSASYYSKLGFVEQAETLERYESLLDRAAQGGLQVTATMRDDAKLCFYITQCCNWVFSGFNPGDFARWIAEPIAHWEVQPAVARMIRAIVSDTPVAVLNHHATAHGSDNGLPREAVGG